MLTPRPEICVMLERSHEHHGGFGDIEVSQKRTKGSRRALTREQHSILLASSHRMSNNVSGFVSVKILAVRIRRFVLPWLLTIVKSLLFVQSRTNDARSRFSRRSRDLEFHWRSLRSPRTEKRK